VAEFGTEVNGVHRNSATVARVEESFYIIQAADKKKKMYILQPFSIIRIEKSISLYLYTV